MAQNARFHHPFIRLWPSDKKTLTPKTLHYNLNRCRTSLSRYLWKPTSMQHSDDEVGIAQVMLKNLIEHRLPRMLDLQQRVNSGECLTDYDIAYIEEALRDANQNKQYEVKFPEYEGLIGQVVHLYREITSQALENQKAKKPY